MSNISIREAETEDVPSLLSLIRELSAYEKLADQVIANEQRLRNTLFGEAPSAHALLCEVDGQPIGYAIYFYNYSTWLARPGIYLEDLYITPEYRRLGAATLLLKKIAGIAVQQNCGRFEWAVLNWNAPAIAFYEQLNAQPQHEWTTYRLTGQSLKELAES